jgi:hypothetical protein
MNRNFGIRILAAVGIVMVVMIYPARAVSEDAVTHAETARAIDVAILKKNAESFAAAINKQDTASLTRLVELPLLVRRAQWEDASKGDGFELGKAHDQIVDKPESLHQFLANLLREVELERARATSNPPKKARLLDRELAGAPAQWQSLEIFVFLRGSGDVEHTVLLGVSPASGMIRGIYIN